MWPLGEREDTGVEYIHMNSILQFGEARRGSVSPLRETAATKRPDLACRACTVLDLQRWAIS